MSEKQNSYSTTGQEIIGIEDVSYEKNGVHHYGVRLYVTSPIRSCGVGYSVQNVYIANVTSAQFRLGAILTLTYDCSTKYPRCTGAIYAD